jgi:hypothetical protein
MIFYANEFYVSSTSEGLEILKRAIKRWLDKKIGPSFRSTSIIPFAEPFKTILRDTGPNEVMIFGTPSSVSNYSLSITYRNNDASVRGRAWFTRIGIERAATDVSIRVTVLLETSEVSPQAASIPVTPSQPGVVYEILKQCTLDEKTPGALIRQLNPTSVETFKADVENPHRVYAIVVISVDDYSEVPHVDIHQLRQRLIGLAQVYEIPTKREAWKLREIHLPAFHTAWDGSVTVIGPPKFNGSAYGRIFRIGEIDAIREDTGLPFDRFLFAELTHRFNLAKSRRHISDAVVSRRLNAFKLENLRQKLGDVSGLQEIVESYEDDRDSANRHAEDLENKLLESEIHTESLRGEIAELEKQVRALQFHLKQSIAADDSTKTAASSMVLTLPISLSDIPDWIEEGHPGVLVFTGRATRTLKSSPFEDLGKAAAAFRSLATRFPAAFQKEIRFQDAVEDLAEIPAKYSGNQSEVTAGLKDGYECIHDGVKYALQKHIGIGTSRDPRYCFRLYFEWEPKLQKIVVLHAGEHLDTKTT